MNYPLHLKLLNYQDLGIDRGSTAPPLEVEFVDDDGEVVNLSGYTIRFRIDGERAGGRVENHGDTVKYFWTPEDTEEAGTYRCQFVAQSGGDILRIPGISPAKLTIYSSV